MGKLNFEEKELLEMFESEELISDNKDINKYVAIAKNTIEKNSRISLRINEKDLRKVKSKAIEIGVPYQTLINMLIHQYAENKIRISL